MKFYSMFLLAITNFSAIFGSSKIVLFNDTENWYHWGCTGTSLALKENIQKLGFEIESFTIKQTYDLQQVPSFELFDNIQCFNDFCETNPLYIQAIKSADAVVITGEGTIHDLRSGPQALLYLAYISKTFLDKHVEIINHSAYPKDDPLLSANFFSSLMSSKASDDSKPTNVNFESELEKAQNFYERVYKVLDFVAIREVHSFNEMKKMNINSVLSFDCLPLYIRNHFQSQKQINKKSIVVSGSVAHANLEQICRYIEKLSRRGFEVKVLIGAAAYPAADDLSFVDFLQKNCNAPWELVKATSLNQWLNVINQSALLVSGRFHHSIAAFCLNTPFIALNSNTPKVHAICSYFEMPEPLCFSDQDLCELLLNRTEKALAAQDQNNSVKIDQLCSLAEKNFDGLKALKIIIDK